MLFYRLDCRVTDNYTLELPVIFIPCIMLQKNDKTFWEVNSSRTGANWKFWSLYSTEHLNFDCIINTKMYGPIICNSGHQSSLWRGLQ